MITVELSDGELKLARRLAKREVSHIGGMLRNRHLTNTAHERLTDEQNAAKSLLQALDTQEAGDDWPVHVVILQFARDPDTDDPINWDWTSLLDTGAPVHFVTGGVVSTADPEDL